MQQNILDFATDLGVVLSPAQTVVLKCLYGLSLDKHTQSVKFSDFYNESRKYLLTEKAFVKYLMDRGMCNLATADTKPMNELLLIAGRRSGKDLLGTLIVSYETQKLLTHDNPHQYYNLPEGTEIVALNVSASPVGVQNVLRKEEAYLKSLDNYKSSSRQGCELRFRTQHEIDANPNNVEKGSVVVVSKVSSAKPVHGYSSSCVFLNEFASFEDIEGNPVDRQVYNSVVPSLFTLVNKDEEVDGKLIIATSLSDRQGATKEFFEESFTPVWQEHRAAFRIPTWCLRPAIDNDFLKDEFNKKGKELFDREYGSVI